MRIASTPQVYKKNPTQNLKKNPTSVLIADTLVSDTLVPNTW